MKTKSTIVIGRDAAIRYAEKNCTFHADWYIEKAQRGIGGWQLESFKKYQKAFEVEGYSKIVDVYKFSVYPEDKWREEPEHIVLEDPSIAVQIVDTGELFRIYASGNQQKTFGLAEFENRYWLKTQDFKFGEEAPQYVGTATKKKIEAWVDYLHRKMAAEEEYDRHGWELNKSFQKVVKARFPNAKFNLDKNDGWMIECWFCKDGIEYHYQAYHGGRFYRDLRYDRDAVQSTEKLLGIDF